MNDVDMDIRHQHLTDLQRQLEIGFHVPDDQARPLVDAVLKRVLTEKSSEVKGVAVQCLGVLCPRLKKEQVERLGKELVDVLKTTKVEDERDIAVDALKKLIAGVDETYLEVFASLSDGILRVLMEDNVSAILSSLDVITELLKRAGARLSSDHDRLVSRFVDLLYHSSEHIRFSVVRALSPLALAINEETVRKLVKQTLLKHLTRPPFRTQQEMLDVKITVQAFGSLASNPHFRHSSLIEEVLPPLKEYIQSLHKLSSQEIDPDDAEDDAFREAILQTMNSVVTHCAVDLSQDVVRGVLESGIDSLSYDPNYVEDFGGDMEVEGEVYDDVCSFFFFFSLQKDYVT
jgi:hypothetical protein